MQTVVISDDKYACLQQYLALAGGSVERCVDEALYDWIKTTATARISQIEKQNSIVDIGAWKRTQQN